MRQGREPLSTLDSGAKGDPGALVNAAAFGTWSLLFFPDCSLSHLSRKENKIKLKEKRIKEKGAQDPLVFSRTAGTVGGSRSEQGFALRSASAQEPLGGCSYFTGSLRVVMGDGAEERQPQEPCFHQLPQVSSLNSIKQVSKVSLKVSKFFACFS